MRVQIVPFLLQDGGLVSHLVSARLYLGIGLLTL